MKSKTQYNTNVPHYETDTGDKILYPFSPPIFQSYVDEKFTSELISEGRKLNKEEDDWNPRLAGQHKFGRSYHYKKDFCYKAEKYLIEYVKRFFKGLQRQYGEQYDGHSRLLQIPNNQFNKTDNGVLRLDSLWINFSQKLDTNIPHTHSGELSFVIYCKVPEKIFTEQTDSNTKRAGEIIFQYGELITPLTGAEYPVKPSDNLIFIFPAKLRHFVPPYYVDEERISVSGNFKAV